MAKTKKIKAIVKLQIPAGQANPAPPIGPALGQHGVNIMAFCKEYNERTASQAGLVIPAEITIYEDRSFTFVTKTPPTVDLIKRALGMEKGMPTPGLQTGRPLPKDKLREIAISKMPDLNAYDIPAAERTVAGTARSMGVNVEVS